MIVHIFGGSGSGTSTLGRALAAEFGYTFLDTDDFYWLPTDPPFREKRPREDRLALVRSALSDCKNAALCGSLCGWGDSLTPLFQLAVRIELPPEIRLERLKRREEARYGARLLPGGDMERQHREFMDWAARYDAGGPEIRSRALHDEWQKTLSCPVVQLDGRMPVGELLRQLAPYLL